MAVPELPHHWRVGTPPKPASDLEARRKKRRDRDRFITAATLLAVLGMIVGLLRWLRFDPKPVICPIVVAQYQRPEIPNSPRAGLDAAALLAGVYFPTTLDAAAGPPEDPKSFAPSRSRIDRALAALADRAVEEPLLIYISAAAVVDTDDAVRILAADADPGDLRSGTPLRSVLQAVRACPSRRKLLVLDLGRSLVGGRFGALVDDVPAHLDAELAAVEDPYRLTLMPCAAGQFAWESEDLDRTVFGFYIEAGLRGWADGVGDQGRIDGLISAGELAAYVTREVGRWSRHARGPEWVQTPRAEGDYGRNDFALVGLPRGRLRDPLMLSEKPLRYPEALRKGWALRDAWQNDETDRLDPRGFRHLERALIEAERRWVEAGRAVERWPAEGPADLKIMLDDFVERRQKARAAALIVPPRPRSAALARALASAPKPPADVPAITGPLESLLTGVIDQETLAEDALSTPTTVAQRAEARAKRIDEFLDLVKTRNVPDGDLAEAALQQAIRRPSLRTISILGDLFRRKYPEGVPLVELTVLAGLGEYANRIRAGQLKQAEADWPEEAVRQALEAFQQVELASVDPRPLPWSGALIGRANRDRHDGLALLASPGFAPTVEAASLLRDAAQRAGIARREVVATVLDAHRAWDRAMTFLPDLADALDRPGAETTLAAFPRAVEATDLVFEALTPPPPERAGDLDELSPRLAELKRRIEALRAALEDVEEGWTSQALADLAQSARNLAASGAVTDPDAYIVRHRLDAILATPVGSVDARAALWDARRALDRALWMGLYADMSIGMPDPDDATPDDSTTSSPDDGSVSGWGQVVALAAGAAAARRAELRIALLKLGGVEATTLRALEDALTAAKAGTGTDLRPWHALAQALRLAETAPETHAANEGRAVDPGELARLDRRARVAAAWPALRPGLDDPDRDPAVRLRAVQSRALWAYLSETYAAEAQDPGGISVGVGGPTWTAAADEYAAAAAPRIPRPPRRVAVVLPEDAIDATSAAAPTQVALDRPALLIAQITVVGGDASGATVPLELRAYTADPEALTVEFLADAVRGASGPVEMLDPAGGDEDEDDGGPSGPALTPPAAGSPSFSPPAPTAFEPGVTLPVSQAPVGEVGPRIRLHAAPGVPIRLTLRAALRLGARTPTTQAEGVGILLQARAFGRSFHRRMPLDLVDEADRPKLVLSTNPERPGTGRGPGQIRVRPGTDAQPWYLFLHNPTPRARTVVVQLTAGELVLTSPLMDLGGQADQLVALRFPAPGGEAALPPALTPPSSAPATPPAPGAAPTSPFAATTRPKLPELVGGTLEFRIFDLTGRPRPQPGQGPAIRLSGPTPPILERRTVEIRVAEPHEIIEVVDSIFEPPSARTPDENRLKVTVRSAGELPLADPPARVSLELPAGAVPGLGRIRTAPVDGAVFDKGNVELLAAGLELDRTAEERGRFYVGVDGHRRGIVFTATFARQGDPTRPQVDFKPAVRIKCDRIAVGGIPFPVAVEVDNPPADARLELAIGTRNEPDGTFTIEILKTYATPIRRRIGFDAFGRVVARASLTFEADAEDWTASLEGIRSRGARVVRARLIDRDGQELAATNVPVVFDEPDADGPGTGTGATQVRFLDLPNRARFGSTVLVKMTAEAPLSGWKAVGAFVGNPGKDGAEPPGVEAVPAVPLDDTGTAFVTRLTLPSAAPGTSVPITARFTSGIGAVVVGRAMVVLTATDPQEPGRILGRVEEGGRPQPNLTVFLGDPQGRVLARTMTAEDGSYSFDPVEPGPYRLLSMQPVTRSFSEKTVVVRPKGSSRIDLPLFRLRR
ncbi:MAG: hypothetical protein GC206_13170 [Alphaproteobacteria bacterium]|nr:hypothetical protein [Alphaproteobacteria bacterium]